MFTEREAPNLTQIFLIRKKDPEGHTISLGIAEVKVNKAKAAGGKNDIDTYEVVSTHWILGTPPERYDPVNDSSVMSEPLVKSPLKIKAN
jgi:hypothetical protein